MMTSQLSSPVVSVRQVTYDYPGHRALDEVSFDLLPSSVTALVGPNGAGKTTLLRSMAALDEPMSGSIVINGLDVWKHPREAHRFMGYLPDHFGLYPDLSARRCLIYAARARGLDESETREAVDWAASQTMLLPLLEQRAGTLSRGQRQRLALAQAIVHRPLMLLLDEPASGLDPQARADLSDLMRSLAASGITLLISSHILAELESYCTAMLVLEKGRLLAHQKLGGEPSGVALPSQQERERELRIRLASGQQDAESLQIWLAARGLCVEPGAGEAVLVRGLFDEAAQTQLLRDLLAADWNVLEFNEQARSLQNVYLQTVASQGEKP
ncbi:multidrug ABC transporter ATP-binding protein [Betaproteobacteria bacterium]|nr:multidrug ABC transporter ATP-binding protein [Betaproteobacteria bacterium]